MARATWDGAVVAESDTCESVEGNVYFPIESVIRDYLRESMPPPGLRLEGRSQLLRRRG